MLRTPGCHPESRPRPLGTTVALPAPGKSTLRRPAKSWRSRGAIPRSMLGACPVPGGVRFLVCAEGTMNRFDWISLLAGSAISLGILEPGPGATAQDKGEVVELGGLKSRVPAGWVAVKPDQPQFVMQYRLDPINDDKEDARLTVEFLGNRKGGTAGESVKLWK